MTTRGEINSNFYQIVNVDANGTPTSIKSQFIQDANNANYANFANHANVSDVANSVNVSNVVGIGNIATINLDNSSLNVLYGNGNWAPAQYSVGANYANYAGNITFSDQPNITSTGTLVSLTVTGNILSGNATLGNLVTANYFSGDGNLLSNIQGGNVSGQVANALVAGTVYTNSQPNITSVGTLVSLDVTGNITTGNASLGNLASANYISGNANLVTGLTLSSTNFTDVAVSSPVNQQVLQYNGSNWVNNTLSIPSSAGSGVTFWFTSPVILAQGANNDIQLDTLNSIPNTSAIQYASRSINSSTQVVSGVVTLPLDRTQFDAGNWDFSIWANANSSGGTTSIQPATYQVNPGSGTITITGTGTSRSATATSGTPFANSVGSANVLLASYIQTPHGLFQITAKTSSTIVTVTTPTTYVNESAVSYFVYDLFYSLPSKVISPTLSEYIFSTTTSSLVINTTTRLGILVIGTTTNTRTISVSYNDTNQSSHVSTPFITLHDNLAGLQGGQSSEYYHLTNSEYTGTGTGNFVRQTSPTLTTPNIGIATGTSLSLTANASAGNVLTDNLLHANGVAWTFGGNPGGSNTQLQYNNNGSFGGISTVTYNGTNISLGAINTVKITGGIANDVIRTDGTGNLSFQAIATSLTVGTRTTPVTIPTTNYQMNVLARTGNVVVSVN